MHLAAKQVFGRLLSAADVKAKAEAALHLVQLEHAMDKYPFEIAAA